MPCWILEPIGLRPFCTISLGNCFAGCSRRMGRDGTKSKAGRRAGPSPWQQQDEPREAEVTHRDWEGKLRQLNLKSRPGRSVRSFHYYPQKNTPTRENGRDTEEFSCTWSVIINPMIFRWNPFIWRSRENLAEGSNTKHLQQPSWAGHANKGPARREPGLVPLLFSVATIPTISWAT